MTLGRVTYGNQEEVEKYVQGKMQTHYVCW
jgi:hypothetical protein